MATASDKPRNETQKLATYDFTLILGGVKEFTDELADALYRGGCDDATLGCQEGQIFLDFSRESTSFIRAIMTSISEVEKSGVAGLKVIEVRPPDKVTIDMVNSFLVMRSHLPHDRASFEDEMWQLLIKAGL